MELDFSQHPHRRYNPLNGEWVLVSPHRAKRPWQGKTEETPAEKKPEYDPKCYLCPGNHRAGDATNPEYDSTFVFTNDFASLLPDTPDTDFELGNLLRAKGEKGTCRVICFSPRHDLTIPELSPAQIRNVVDVWTKQYIELGKLPYINYVQIFENKGEIMGCSNPHPHGQIWAQESIPGEPAKELKQQADYYHKEHHCLLCDYLKLEQVQQARIVIENNDFIVVVPFWAVWPFETMVLSKRHLGGFQELTDTEKNSLADIIKRLTIRYDNLFSISFPYSAGFHAAPTDGEPHPEWHFHMHFYPPLLRSATVKKFMVGYEMLANPQRDITAETSAERLRDLTEKHYKNLTPG